MKRIFAYLIPVLILLGAFAGMALKLKRNKQIAQERVYHFDPAETAIPEGDATAEQSPEDGPGDLTFTGAFEPNRETRISAEVQGKINRVWVDAGSIVSKGQTLVQLDDALLQLQLQSADVQIEGLEADVKRYSVLAKADAVQGVQQEKAELGLKSARVQRATIQEQINKTTVKAPFGGVIVTKLNEEGGFAAPGVPLLHLMDIAQLKFTVLVSESDLKYFQPGRSYAVVADAYPDRSLPGKVSMIGSKANAGNSFPVQFTVQNFQNQALKAGMFGKVTLPAQN
jgi:RND family efflux transporter MFP subunit